MENYKIKLSSSEIQYRNQIFNQDYSKILNLEVKCTICSADLNWMLLFKKQVMVHPILEVLICEGCLISHTSTDLFNFCLWCGCKSQKGYIVCSNVNCSTKFCRVCIRKNFGNSACDEAVLQNDWQCYLCECKKLWVLRGVCVAAQKFAEVLRNVDSKDGTNEDIDCAICMSSFESVKKLSCSHKFHKKCLDTWTLRNRSCPICRSAYVEGKTVELHV